MERNIITTVSFGNNKVSISSIEKLSTNNVEIFTSTDDIKNTDIFLKSSLTKIEELVGGKVSNVTFVIEPSKNVNAKIELDTQPIKLVGETVAKTDISNVIGLLKVKYEGQNDKRVTMVQPLKFQITSTSGTKSYWQAPINKHGDKLTMTASITTISKKVYDYIYSLSKKLDVKIGQILLTSQVLPYSYISRNALENGSVLINIDESHVNISVNKAGGTLDTISLYKFGYRWLIKQLAKEFACPKDEALSLLEAHGSFVSEKERVIFWNKFNNMSKKHTNTDLQRILGRYVVNLMSIAKKYLSQQNLFDLPIIVSGKLNSLSGFEKYLSKILTNVSITAYKPLEFVEFNDKNADCLGAINFMDKMDLMLGSKCDTIVHTNPNTLNVPKTDTKNIVSWFKKKIGEIYDWN